MKSIKNLLCVFLLIISPTLLVRATNVGGSERCPGKGGCGPIGTTTIESSSLVFTFKIGEIKTETPANFATMSRLGILEKGGLHRLRNFSEFYQIYYGDDSINRNLLTFEFEIPQISDSVYHPSVLEIHNSGEFDAIKKIYAGTPYYHQVQTGTSFAQVDPLPAAEGEGFTIRSWRNLDGPPNKVSGFYETPTVEPLSIIRFERPPVNGNNKELYLYTTENFGLASTYQCVEHHVYDPVADKLIVTTFADHNVGQADQIIRRETLEYDREEIIEFPSADADPDLNSKEWTYILTRHLEEAANDKNGAIGALKTVKKTKETYVDFSDTLPGGEFGMRRMIEMVDDPEGDALTTSYDYYFAPNNELLHGRLKSASRPDGSWVYHDITDSATNPSPQTVTYSSYLNKTMDEREEAKKVISEYQANSFTKTTYLDGVQVAKSETTVNDLSGGDRDIIQKSWTGTEYATTTTRFHRHSGNGIQNGRRAWRQHPDGTYTLWSYSGSEDFLTITEERGSGNRHKIRDGKKVVTTYNAAYQPIDVQTYDIQPDGNEANAGKIETLISFRTTIEVDGGAVDPQGRPTKWKHFDGGNTYFTTMQYGCCGLDLSIDRSGEKTIYFRDKLRRLYKTTTTRSSGGPLIEGLTLTEGLTTTRETRSGQESIFLGSTTRSLSGLSMTYQLPDADGDGVAETQTSITDLSAPAGPTTTITAPDDTTTVSVNFLDGRTKTMTDQEGHITTYSYGTHDEEGGGQLRTVSLPGNNQETTTYTDQLGRSFKMEYADGAESTQSYHSFTNSARAGSRGKLKSITDADLVTTTYGYNREGERTTTTAPLPNASGGAAQARVNFSETSVVASVTVHETIIAPAHKTVSQVNGIETNTSYRSIDGRISASVSFGRESLTVSTVPNDGSWTVTTTTPDGQTTRQSYSDGLLQKNEFFDNEGLASANLVTSSSYTYDPFGRALTHTDARTGTATYDEDEDGFPDVTDSGNILYTKDAGDRVTTFSYDVMGRRLTVDAPNSLDESGATLANITHTAYTPRGQVQVTWGDQTYPHLYQYDEQGRMTQLHTWKTAPTFTPVAASATPTLITVPTGSAVTTWVYDDQRGWLTEKNYAGETGNGPGSTADYQYTPAGRLANRTWERGVTTDYSYQNGVLTKVDYSDATPDLEYQYDNFGRLTEVKRAGAAHASYSYNPANLLLAEEHLNQEALGSSRRVYRLYDDLLRPISISDQDFDVPGLYSHAYTYDSAGRLKTVTNHAGDIFQYKYLAKSFNLIETCQTPVHTVTNTWEGDRDVLQKKENQADMTMISSYQYTVNDIGQRTAVSKEGSAFSGTVNIDWAYNQHGELVEADHNIASQDRAYQYDAIGNRQKTSETLLSGLPATANYQSNALNQYLSVPASGDSSLSPSYDADGNAISYPLPEDQSSNATLEWDAENRLVKVTKPDGTRTEFEYDYLSRRMRKAHFLPGDSRYKTEERYIYDGWNMIEQRKIIASDPSFPLSNSFLITHSYPTWGLDLSGSMQGAGGVGGLLGIRHSTGPNDIGHYVTYDGNGNVSEYLNESGSVVGHFEYDPFGNITVSSPSNTSGLDFRFSTKKHDEETGLYYYGYRYYDPVTGRWPSRDPIEERGGINLYGMLSNDAVNQTDVSGLAPQGKGRKPAGSRTCKQKKRRLERRIDRLVSRSLGKTPDCSGEKGCTLITVIVEVGDPCGGLIDKKVGHTGIGIGDDYYDFGPSNGQGSPGVPWWDDPNNGYWDGKPPGTTPADIDLDDIVDNINRLAPQATVAVEFCACEATTKQIQDYWNRLYQSISDGTQPDWKIGGAQCTSTTCSSINGRPTSGLTSPNSFLFGQLSKYKNGCGQDKGKKANIKKLKGFD